MKSKLTVRSAKSLPPCTPSLVCAQLTSARPQLISSNGCHGLRTDNLPIESEGDQTKNGSAIR